MVLSFYRFCNPPLFQEDESSKCVVENALMERHADFAVNIFEKNDIDLLEKIYSFTEQGNEELLSETEELLSKK